MSNNPSGQNQTGTDCYVRVAVGYSNSDIGKAVTMKNTDSENWIYGDDGFYYYKKDPQGRRVNNTALHRISY